VFNAVGLTPPKPQEKAGRAQQKRKRQCIVQRKQS
jgi:hypothetical protein